MHQSGHSNQIRQLILDSRFNYGQIPSGEGICP
jgi:hypothetical protein